MSETNVLHIASDVLKEYFNPILTLNSPEDVFLFFEGLGWNIEDILGTNASSFTSDIDVIKSIAEQVIAFIEDPDDIADLAPIIGELDAFIQAVQNLPDNLSGFSPSILDELARDIFEGLFVMYLSHKQPLLFSLLELLTIIRKEESALIVDNDKIVKSTNILPKVHWEVFSELFSDPLTLFGDYYWPNGFTNVQVVNEVAQKLFVPIAGVLESFGFQTLLGRGVGPEEYDADSESRMDGFLSVSKQFSISDIDTNVLGVTFGLVPESEGGPGVMLLPFGKTTIAQTIEDWYVLMDIAAAVGGIEFTRNGVNLFENPSQDAFSTQIVLAKIADETGNAFLIGNSASSHFSINEIAIRTEIAANAQQALYGVYLLLTKAKLVIKGGEGDGFISEIIGDGFTAELDLEIGYSNQSGFHFKGSGNLEFVLPSHISLGPIDIMDMTLGLGFNDGFAAKAFATVKLELGPFVAVIEGMGIRTDLSLPDQGGNLGPVDLGFGFKPPTGIGLSLDASVVKGGGYLFFDHEKEEYGGALELVIADKISVVAIGLITTRFPDGSKGFSLLLLISVEFSPGIALGMGFFLSGLGGMIGINRTVNTDALREGVKQGSVDHILFPTDVVANIQRIITDLREFFPPQRDQFIIGLMAKITWGVPTLLQVEFGLAVEFASPVRIAILGVIKLVLPTEDEAILRIQVNFIGVIDFEEGYLSFDASLYGSKILTFTLEGDMALRIFWGKQKEFLMSVGGFHPSFNPPAFLRVGNMTRLTLNILSGNPRLTLSTYFAITSNTVQFGAEIDFYFKVSKFKVLGYFGFDVLFQFSPFRFIASIRAGVEVKVGSTTLLSIKLAFELQGPTPWIANGTASFKILFISIDVKFSHTWGERREDALPNIAVLPKVIEALEQSRNWVGELPANRFLLTTMKKIELEEGEVLMHSVGTLTVKQNIVPIGLELDKFGNYQPQDIKKVDIIQMTINGDSVGFELVKDAFAPAEFIEMGDADKLASESYQDENSGAKANATESLQMNYGINRLVNYEVNVSDYDRGSDTPYELYAPFKRDGKDNRDIFRKMAKGSAVAKSVLSKELFEKNYKNENEVVLGQERFTVANTDSFERVELNGFTGGSKAEADSYLKALLKNNPNLKGQLQIVPEYELV